MPNQQEKEKREKEGNLTSKYITRNKCFQQTDWLLPLRKNLAISNSKLTCSLKFKAKTEHTIIFDRKNCIDAGTFRNVIEG